MWNYKDKSFYEQELYKDLYKNADKMLGYPGIYSMNCRISVFDVEDNKELGCVSSYSMYFCAIDSYPRQFYNLPELLYYLYINNFDLGFIDILKNLQLISPKLFIDNVVKFYNINYNNEAYKTFCQLICPEKILVDDQLTILSYGLWLIGLKNNKKYLRFDREF